MSKVGEALKGLKKYIAEHPEQAMALVSAVKDHFHHEENDPEIETDAVDPQKSLQTVGACILALQKQVETLERKNYEIETEYYKVKNDLMVQIQVLQKEVEMLKRENAIFQNKVNNKMIFAIVFPIVMMCSFLFWLLI